MKPLRLVLQAFGPYAARQELDFADLQGQDFFLIHGPTGAGKTSILDGISYALYGETSGGLREARDMRSHFADPALETRVRFEFQLGEHIYRVDRCPEQMVPKQRGGGQKNLSADEYRRAAAALMKQGADGVYLFNFFTSREGGTNAYEPPFEVLRDLGAPPAGK